MSDDSQRTLDVEKSIRKAKEAVKQAQQVIEHCVAEQQKWGLTQAQYEESLSFLTPVEREEVRGAVRRVVETATGKSLAAQRPARRPKQRRAMI